MPELFNVPAWGCLLPLLLQGSLGKSLAATAQKLSVVYWLEMPPLTFQIYSPSFSSMLQDAWG